MSANVKSGRSLLWCLVALVSCNGDGGGNQNILDPGGVARVEVTPATLTVPTGGTGQLNAATFDAGGSALSGRAVSWSSNANSVASVSSAGLVTAVSVGTAIITATSEGRRGTSQVTVTQSGGAPTQVVVAPSSATILTGGAAQLNATAYDAQNRATSQAPVTWSSSNTAVVTVSTTGLVSGIAAGSAVVTATAGAASGRSTITVAAGVPPGNIIDVNSSVTHQTIVGWSAASQNGWFDCNPQAFSIYKDALHDRVVNELGINRLTVALRSGFENTRDYHAEFVAGQINDSVYRASWFSPVNDNADPQVTDASRFKWSKLDGYFDNSIIPIRQRLQARGEQLYLVLTYVDFVQQGATKPFIQMKQPEEYAELVVAAFRHLQSKYGFVPDALEMLLEPEHTTLTAGEIGRALVATANRLRGAGFQPAFIAPSTTSMFNASVYYDQMLSVPGVLPLIDELAYHRYVAVSSSNLQAIVTRARRDNIKTSMLEHIGSGWDDLYEDLTVANVSAWMQYSMAFCGNRDNPDNQGVYYQINQTDPANPKINITNDSKLFRQVFQYVRRGAVRLGATSGNTATLQPMAFRNVNGKQVVVVRVRGGALFSVRGLAAGTYGINYSTTGTQWNVNLPDLTVGSGGTLQTAMPRDGVLTIFAR